MNDCDGVTLAIMDRNVFLVFVNFQATSGQLLSPSITQYQGKEEQVTMEYVSIYNCSSHCTLRLMLLLWFYIFSMNPIISIGASHLVSQINTKPSQFYRSYMATSDNIL